RGLLCFSSFYWAKRTYPRPQNLAYNEYALLNRGRRRSRRSKAEQGGCADNAHSMERREAQGPSQEPARPGTPTPLKTWVPESWRETPASLAGEGSLASSLAPSQVGVTRLAHSICRSRL